MLTMVDEAVVQTATRRIVGYFDPERIIFFGSRAWDDVREDSDHDFLVIAPFQQPR